MPPTLLRNLFYEMAVGLTWVGMASADTVSDFTLANGMEVVVIEDHRAPVVTHMVWYRVGAADEPLGHSGIAHFFEHLMFKGTPSVGPENSRLRSRRRAAATTPLPVGITPPTFSAWRPTGWR